MSSKEPKKPKLKEVPQLNIDTSSHQNEQEDPKVEDKGKNANANLPKQSEGNIVTTMNSLTPHNQHPLYTSNISIISISNNPNKKGKKKQFYSFGDEYYDELYLNLILDEQRSCKKINCNYMNFQNDINDKMRAILVDWLIEVHFKLNMQRKTLFHCIFIIDAYLSKKTIERTNFQLLGLAALLIACKESEINYPPLPSFIAFSENAFTLEKLKEMEINIIQELDYDIFAPTAEEFFAINAEYFEFTEKQKYFGEYFLDASLISYKLLKYKQSTIAVASGYIVIKFFKLNGIHLILYNTNSDVKPKDVKDCVRDLTFLVKDFSKSSLEATKNKYLSDKCLNVAKLLEDKLNN